LEVQYPLDIDLDLYQIRILIHPSEPLLVLYGPITKNLFKVYVYSTETRIILANCEFERFERIIYLNFLEVQKRVCLQISTIKDLVDEKEKENNNNNIQHILMDPYSLNKQINITNLFTKYYQIHYC